MGVIFAHILFVVYSAFNTTPGVDPASKVSGAISVIFSSYVSLQFHYCKREEVYFTTLL